MKNLTMAYRIRNIRLTSKTCRPHGSPISPDRRARDFVPGSYVSFTNERPKRNIRRMLMRRPVSCSDPARGIILAEIKFWNSRDPRDDSWRAFEDTLLPISVALWKSSASRDVPLPTPDVTII